MHCTPKQKRFYNVLCGLCILCGSPSTSLVAASRRWVLARSSIGIVLVRVGRCRRLGRTHHVRIDDTQRRPTRPLDIRQRGIIRRCVRVPHQQRGRRRPAFRKPNHRRPGEGAQPVWTPHWLAVVDRRVQREVRDLIARAPTRPRPPIRPCRVGIARIRPCRPVRHGGRRGGQRNCQDSQNNPNCQLVAH